MTWTEADLEALADREELTLVLARFAKPTLRVPVWVVVADGEVIVRSYLGVTSGWYRRASALPRQAVAFGGPDVVVDFEPIAASHLTKKIDAAYSAKYKRFDYEAAMSKPQARDAGFRISRVG
jgi:hypothetical protein